MSKKIKDYAPLVVSLLLFLSGILSLISVFREITTSFFITKEAQDYLPIAVTSRTVTLIIAILLITTARGLWRKNKDAWKAATILTLASIFFHLLKGFNFEEIIFSVFILVILIWSRRIFSSESKTKITLETTKDFLTSAIILALYFLVGNVFLKNGVPDKIFHQSLTIVPAALIIIYILRLFENYISRPVKTSALEILPIIKKYGDDTLSYFATNSKKEIFFGQSGQTIIPFAIKRNLAISTGDPIGPKNEIYHLIEKFKNQWNKKNVSTAFYGVSDKYLRVFKKLSYKVIKIGEEAIVNVKTYDFEKLYQGRHGKRFRRAIRHVDELGIDFEFLSLEQLPASYYSQMVEISEEWLKEFSSGKEAGFSMNLARLPSAYDIDCRIALAVDKKKTIPQLIAFLVFTPVYNGNGYSLDIMRRKKDSPNGVNEFLIVKTIAQLKLEKEQILSLNFAALAESSGEKSLLLTKIASLLSKRFRGVQYVNTLYDFNKKFYPQWKSRYLAYEKITDFPNLLIAIFDLEGIFEIDLNFAKKLMGFLK